MYKKIKILCFFLILVLCLSYLNAKLLDYADKQIIVKFKEIKFDKTFNKFNLDKKQLFKNTASHNYNIKTISILFKNSKPNSFFKYSNIKNKTVKIPDLSKTCILEFDEGVDLKEIVHDYNNDLNVEYAELIYKRHKFKEPNDPNFIKQWGLHNTGQNISGDVGIEDKDIDAPSAWDSVTGSTNVIVAVIDDGVDYNHEDLASNIWTNIDEISNSLDDDVNGYVDDILGWDFSGDTSQSLGNIIPDNDPIGTGSDYHGTHCAGIIGAVGDNSKGITGVCFKISIMPVKIFPNAYDSIAALAIKYAAENGAHVINCSWGGTEESKTIHEAIKYANSLGALVVVASGNSDLDTVPYIGYPAYYEESIAVAALDNKGEKPDFSNYGTWVDVSAPGKSILSTIPNDQYGYLNGTSMATPFVTGLAALIISANNTLTNDEVRSVIETTTDYVYDSNSIYLNQLGFGSINAKNSVLRALNYSNYIANLGTLNIIIAPNPLNLTKNKYLRIINLPQDDSDSLFNIYNIAGEKIRGFDNIDMLREIYWDGKNESGQLVSSGIYVYIYKSNKYKRIGKIAVIK